MGRIQKQKPKISKNMLLVFLCVNLVFDVFLAGFHDRIMNISTDPMIGTCLFFGLWIVTLFISVQIAKNYEEKRLAREKEMEKLRRKQKRQSKAK